jgi:hypothetical protein
MLNGAATLAPFQLAVAKRSAQVHPSSMGEKTLAVKA